jgi:hypothetical protein
MANTMLENSWVDEDLAGHSKLGYIVDFSTGKLWESQQENCKANIRKQWWEPQTQNHDKLTPCGR